MIQDDDLDEKKKFQITFDRFDEDLAKKIRSEIKKFNEEHVDPDKSIINSISSNPVHIPFNVYEYDLYCTRKTSRYSSIKIGIISYLYHNTMWSELSGFNTVWDVQPRPKFCINCNSTSCIHLKLHQSKNQPMDIEITMNRASENCIHLTDLKNDTFDGVCSNCVLDACNIQSVNVDEEHVHLRVLMDEFDIMEFYNYIENIREDKSITN